MVNQLRNLLPTQQSEEVMCLLHLQTCVVLLQLIVIKEHQQRMKISN